MKKRRKVLIILGVIAVALITAIVVLACMAQMYDPNKKIKKKAVEITAGEECNARFRSNYEFMGVTAGTASFRFTPEESAEYTFRGENTSGDKSIFMEMYAMDESLSELLTADNYGGNSEAPVVSDSMEGKAFLTKGQLCYVVVDVYSEETDKLDDIEKAFRLSVSKNGGGAPVELKAGEKIRLTVNKDQQACAMFVPEETAYYDFDTDIVSKDAASGFSSIYGITAEDKTDMIVTDGICLMEAGKTYYVWVGVDETTKKRSRVELSCSRMASETAGGICSIDVSGKTVIEYTAEADMPLIISSSSDGDPDAALYDSEGFMLRQDDDSGGALSGNPKDFALGLQAEKGEVYRICVDGEFAQCTVNIQEYKGDGMAPDSDAEGGGDTNADGDAADGGAADDDETSADDTTVNDNEAGTDGGD